MATSQSATLVAQTIAVFVPSLDAAHDPLTSLRPCHIHATNVREPTHVAMRAEDYGGLKPAWLLPIVDVRRRGCDRRHGLPCRRSRVRVPSSASKAPVNRGFLFSRWGHVSPICPEKCPRNSVRFTIRPCAGDKRRLANRLALSSRFGVILAE